MNREDSIITEAAIIQDLFEGDDNLDANLGFNDNILNIGHDDILTYALPAAIEPTYCDPEITTQSNNIESLKNTAQRFVDEYNHWEVPPNVKGTMIVDSEAPVKVPLTASAAAFLTRSQMKLVLPSLNMTSDLDDINPVICAECGETFSNLEAGNEHVDNNHHSDTISGNEVQANSEKPRLTEQEIIDLEGQFSCELCSYTACYFLDMLLHKREKHNEYHMNPNLKANPNNPHITYMLAEGYQALSEELSDMHSVVGQMNKAIQELTSNLNARKQENKCEVLIPDDPTKVLGRVPISIKCNVCKFTARTEEELREHKREEKAKTKAKYIPPGSLILCPDCDKKFTDRASLNTHVNNVHTQTKYFKCACCDNVFSTENGVKEHMQKEHTKSEKANTSQFPCKKCSHVLSSKESLHHHIKVEHSIYVNLPNWFLIGDSHLNSVKGRMVEKATRGKLFCKGFAHPKQGRAYCSSKNWPNAKYPANNHTDMVPKLLSERPYNGGIILCPGNDISNISHMDKADQYSMAKKSALNMVGVAERALRENPTLKKLVLMEYPHRADNAQLAEISQYSNKVLRSEVNKSELSCQILVGSMGNLKFSSLEEMVDRFGPRNVHPRYDGVHLRGSQGSRIFTECLISAVKATADIDGRRPVGEYQMPKNTVRPRQNKTQNTSISTHNKYNMLN